MNTIRRYGPWLLLALAVMLVPMTATAAITFSASVPNVSVYQQTANSPCVIGDPSCGSHAPAGWTFTQSSGPGSGGFYDLFSPVYVAGAAINGATNPDTIPSSFIIGLDENLATKQGPEVLVAFNTFLCTSSAASSCSTIPLALDSTAGPTNIADVNNGNGYSDMISSTLTLSSGSYYMFEAIVSNDTDGMEQFFIIASGTPPVVPEPGSILMLGTTLIGIGAITRRRLNRKSV